MKKLTIFALAVVMMFVAIPTVASADDGKVAAGVSNFFGGLGRTVMCAPKAVARVAVDTIDTLKFEKPLDVVLAVPRLIKKSAHDVRQEAVDAGESLGLTLALKEPIALEDTGQANAKVTEWGLDGVVDTVFATAAAGVLCHNNLAIAERNHQFLDLKIGAQVGGAVAVSNAAVGALDK